VSSMDRTRIFAIVVLYGQRPAQSATLATLARALRAEHAVDCIVQVWDNGPFGEAALDALPDGFRYHAASVNRGLYPAYEGARHAAEAEGCEWLLTLDQDTALPEDFFSAIGPGLKAAKDDLHIAAIVPHLAEGEQLLSPTYVGIGRAKPLPAKFSGVPLREARAFNSAALLRVSALDAIGGFDPCFWLDYLDNSLHHQLFVRGWRMYVLGSVRLEHRLSLLNYRERLSLARFRNFLGAEAAYIDLYGSRLAKAAYTAQLGVRWMNQLRRGESVEIRLETRRAWLRRFTMSRRQRLLEWRRDAGCGDRR
jgi:GT2 family glycosyltransferase